MSDLVRYVFVFLIALVQDPGGSVIKTAQGELRILEVQRGDRGPADCEVGLPFCRQAATGMQVVTIRLSRENGHEMEIDEALDLVGQAVSGKPTSDSTPHLLSTTGAPIFSNLGAVERNKVAFGIATPGHVRLVSSASATTIAITFEVSARAANLQLVWPGNAPLALRESKH